MKKVTVEVKSTPTRYLADALEKADLFVKEIKSYSAKSRIDRNGDRIYTVELTLKRDT